MSSFVKEFNDYRSRMNEVILSKNNLVMKRLWNPDTNTCEKGTPDTKTKEMPGLVVPPEAGCFAVMIASNIALADVMNWELQQGRCMRSSQWPAEYREELGNNE